MNSPLSGRRIVVTRPRAQAGALADMIAARGGTPIVFPALEIRALEDSSALDALIDRLHDFDWAFFVSPSAVACALERVALRRAWPQRVAVAALGRGSERALAGRGFRDITAPRCRFDSEALLELLPRERVAGKRIVVFRGEGGREHLGDTLRERGAAVEYIACYRRERPAADPTPLIEAWSRAAVDAVTATSSEGLANFFTMLGAHGQPSLQRTPFFVTHARIAAHARGLGLLAVFETEPGDAGLVAGLELFFAGVHAA